MFAFGVVAKLLLVLGYFIIRSEQQPPPTITCRGLPIPATDVELRKITGEIWKADAHRLKVNAVVNNIRGQKFFKNVDVASLAETYKTMIDLFNNYDAFKGRVEPFDQDHLKRENDFLDAIINTGPIEKARLWLLSKGLPEASTDSKFRKELRKYWFTVYNRSGVRSSGFGHTFAGEIYFSQTTNKKQANGLHNWLRMHLEENPGKLTNVNDNRNSKCPLFVKDMKFYWKPSPQSQIYPKGISTAFIGASPEVEIAISTICLLVSCPNNDCPIRLDGNRLNMMTYPWNGKTLTISSSHPRC